MTSAKRISRVFCTIVVFVLLFALALPLAGKIANVNSTVADVVKTVEVSHDNGYIIEIGETELVGESFNYLGDEYIDSMMNRRSCETTAILRNRDMGSATVQCGRYVDDWMISDALDGETPRYSYTDDFTIELNPYSIYYIYASTSEITQYFETPLKYIALFDEESDFNREEISESTRTVTCTEYYCYWEEFDIF